MAFSESELTLRAVIAELKKIDAVLAQMESAPAEERGDMLARMIAKMLHRHDMLPDEARNLLDN